MSNKDVALIELKKIFGFSPKLKDLAEHYEKLPNGLPTVAAFGLLKAGKSTFLNAFTDDVENNRFAHGAIRTTVENQIFEYNNIQIMDTPGIDANNLDTLVAFDGLKSIDVFLFIHNPKTGELDSSEVEFLEKLAAFFPRKSDLVENMICIMTHKAGVDDVEKIHVSERISVQFKSIFGAEPAVIFVESLSYFKAKKENKTLLLKSSGIDTAWEMVNARTSTAFSGRDAKKTQLISNIKNELKNVKHQFEQQRFEHQIIQQHITDEVKKLRQQINRF
jgi:hypothetical protein